MPAIRSTHVEVYVFRRLSRRVEFLLLRRSPRDRQLPGAWQPITGRRQRLERPLAAAVREVREETGLAPRRWWALETATVWVEPATGAVRVLPLFAAEVAAEARVRLSREHSAYAFHPASVAARRVIWDSQRRGIEAVRRQVLRGGVLSRALEVTDLVRPGPRRRRER